MKKIPHMGGGTLGPWLQKYASNADPGTAIVELGTWLGAGTQYLAEGAPDGVTVHTYDKFQIKGNEVDKAARQGLTVRHKQDSLSVVKEFLKDYDNIIFYKGEITSAKWMGPKISVHVDDACKLLPEFKFAINTFSPYWIPGKTILVLMDFYFYIKRVDIPGYICQKNWMDKHKENFKHIESWEDQSSAAFLYLGGDVTI